MNPLDISHNTYFNYNYSKERDLLRYQTNNDFVKIENEIHDFLINFKHDGINLFKESSYENPFRILNDNTCEYRVPVLQRMILWNMITEEGAKVIAPEVNYKNLIDDFILNRDHIDWTFLTLLMEIFDKYDFKIIGFCTDFETNPRYFSFYNLDEVIIDEDDSGNVSWNRMLFNEKTEKIITKIAKPRI